MENKKSSKQNNLQKALCYAPFGGIVLFFTEQNKSKELMKHIKYGTVLLIVFILIRFIIVGVLMIPLGGILFIIYVGIAGMFGYKAYSGEEFDIEYIDEFEKKVKSNMGDKKEEVKKEKKEDDVLDF